MNEAQSLSGFGGIAVMQLDDNRVTVATVYPAPEACAVIDRRDYDCDQEFMMEVILFARRHGAEHPKGADAAMEQRRGVL